MWVNGSHFQSTLLFLPSHVGGLGNLFTDDKGRIYDEIEDNVVSLFGPYSVIGRAFVVRLGWNHSC